MCVFPGVVYTWCCLCWGLACSVICMWCWSCGWFVPLMANSHGLKQAFSCQCPWVAVGAGAQKATGLVKAVSFLHDTQYECLGPSQRAGQQPPGLGAWSAKGKAWTLGNVHSYQARVLKISVGCGNESQPSTCFRSVSLKAFAWTYSLSKEQSLVTKVLREDIYCFLSMLLMNGGCPPIFVFKRSVFSGFLKNLHL